MTRKSDSRRPTVSATQASRTFASILDQVERGRRFVIRRRGRDICVMSPLEHDRRTASECAALLRGRARVELDDRFGRDLTEVVKTEPAEDRSPWAS